MMKLFFVVSSLFFMTNNFYTILVFLSLIAMIFTLYLNYLSSSICSNMLLWDAPSLILSTLTLWIIMLTFLSSTTQARHEPYKAKFTMTILVLLLVLLAAFSASNLVMFYIFFEASLIPTFLLILGWGYQPERIQAGVYMLMYTVLASLPMLASLLVLHSSSASLSMLLPHNVLPLSLLSSLWVFTIVMAFLVKLPLYLVHLWLPKAHVEAPVSGSMILAGVLLKLGGYGILRILPKFKKMILNQSWFYMTWSLVGGVIISMSCIMQTDVKHLIALSSVAHMAMVMGGLTSFYKGGVNGAVLIMVAHGFCSSGLFCISNMSYLRILSRSMNLMKGMMLIFPSVTMWWFLLSAANMAAPPSLNLLGEVNSIITIVAWNKMSIIPLGMLTFFAAAYTLNLYSTLQHGNPGSSFRSMKSLTLNEYLLLFLHTLPLFLIIIKPSLLLVF